MVNPLQDQLLKAGLVKANQLKKAAKEKRQAQLGNAPDVSADHARQAQQQKAESDRIRNREQQAERERKAQAAQIRQLIETQRLARSGGDSAFQFADDGKIKKIHMHAAQRAQLISGMLAVVKLGQTYELVPSATAEKIALRDLSRVLVFNVQSRPQTDTASDPYADYPVPDDLMW
jgi:uncharacterized protein YaiL (DUF2058 family)